MPRDFDAAGCAKRSARAVVGVGLAVAAVVAVRKDYGPQGACAPKAALLVLIPALLVRAGRKARRR